MALMAMQFKQILTPCPRTTNSKVLLKMECHRCPLSSISTCQHRKCQGNFSRIIKFRFNKFLEHKCKFLQECQFNSNQVSLTLCLWMAVKCLLKIISHWLKVCLLTSKQAESLQARCIKMVKIFTKPHTSRAKSQIHRFHILISWRLCKMGTPKCRMWVNSNICLQIRLVMCIRTINKIPMVSKTSSCRWNLIKLASPMSCPWMLRRLSMLVSKWKCRSINWITCRNIMNINSLSFRHRKN